MLVDLLRNEIKKIICYKDIKDIRLFDDKIEILFKNPICSVNKF